MVLITIQFKAKTSYGDGKVPIELKVNSHRYWESFCLLTVTVETNLIDALS